MSTTSGVTGPPRPPPRSGHQDLAPPSGYKPINVARRVPKSVGPNAGLLVIGGSLLVSWGFWKMGKFNVHRRELKQEKKEIRTALLPLLQAEEDARYVRENNDLIEWERNIMKDVEGWIPGESVYKTRKFMPPSSSHVPSTQR